MLPEPAMSATLSDRPPAHVLIPDGEYRARLVAVVPFAGARGMRLVFSYEIEDGPAAGSILGQSAAPGATRMCKLAAILRDLLGREPTENELRKQPGMEHIGLTCRIIVREECTRSGSRYSEVQRATRI